MPSIVTSASPMPQRGEIFVGKNNTNLTTEGILLRHALDLASKDLLSHIGSDASTPTSRALAAGRDSIVTIMFVCLYWQLNTVANFKGYEWSAVRIRPCNEGMALNFWVKGCWGTGIWPRDSGCGVWCMEKRLQFRRREAQQLDI